MTKEEIRRIQGLMNKVGGLLETDGVSGRNTRRAISDACSRDCLRERKRIRR